MRRSLLPWTGLVLPFALAASARLGRPDPGADPAGPAAPPAAATAPAWQAQVEQLVADGAMTKAKLGLSALSLKTGAVLAQVNPDEPLILASNTKLFTTAAALDLLGKDWRFVTRVYLTAAPDAAGIVTGDLVVKGSGDPNLSGRAHQGKATAVFETWADALAAAQVKTVTGDLVLDDTIFDREAVNAAWPANQLNEWYCAPAGGLALNDDCVDVTVGPGPKPGAPARVTLEPPTAYVAIDNDCTTTADKDAHVIDIQSAPGANRLRVRGQCWEKSGGITRSVPIHDPTLFFGTALKETLARKGIEVKGAPRPADKPFDAAGRPPVATWESDLPATLQVTNRNSQNFYAEQLLKAMGAKASGQGTWPAGLAAIKGVLARVGLADGSYGMTDGSGMARGNTFTAAQVTALLRWVAARPDAQVFLDSLSVSGQAGTLKKRLKEKEYQGRVLGKTGYIASVCTLSGYARTRDGDTVAFSILVNNFKIELWQVRQFQDKVCRLFVDGGAAAPPTNPKRGRH